MDKSVNKLHFEMFKDCNCAMCSWLHMYSILVSVIRWLFFNVNRFNRGHELTIWHTTASFTTVSVGYRPLIQSPCSGIQSLDQWPACKLNKVLCFVFCWHARPEKRLQMPKIGVGSKSPRSQVSSTKQFRTSALSISLQNFSKNTHFHSIIMILVDNRQVNDSVKYHLEVSVFCRVDKRAVELNILLIIIIPRSKFLSDVSKRPYVD